MPEGRSLTNTLIETERRQTLIAGAKFPDLKLQMDKVECVVIGAGVIGLADRAAACQAGREVIVLEAAEGIGTVTSSRNSEVIHAGIYYQAGSLMARMCVSGKRALYRILPRATASRTRIAAS